MILVPRPTPHLPRTLAALRAAGHTSLLPLAITEPHTLPITLPPATQALLLTSPLGVHPGLPTHLPAYCVGSATAEAARTLGLQVVYTGTNNGVTMARDIFELKLPRIHFTHIHGDHAHMEWHTILQLAGHTVTPLLAYQTRRIQALPPGLLPQLPRITHTLLFSSGSASHLANLVKQANIQLTGTAIALSPAVAQAARPHWPAVVKAAKPTLESMVKALMRITNNE